MRQPARTSPGDDTYLDPTRRLASLARARDGLAGRIKAALEAAAFREEPVSGARQQLAACRGLIAAARDLAAGIWPPGVIAYPYGLNDGPILGWGD